MSETILKTVRKYGNSGGVYVPRSWVGGMASIELVEEPSDPVKNLISSLPLEHVVSIIIYGSHARREADEGSDFDILVITDDNTRPGEFSGILGKFSGKNYHIEIKTQKDAMKAAANDPLFHKVLKDEGVAVINHGFLDELKKISPGKKGINTRLSLSESSLNIVKELLKFRGDNRNLVYSLVMRLKEIMLIECFIENRKYSLRALEREASDYGIKKKEFGALLGIYRAVRDNKKSPKHEIKGETISKLVSMLDKKMKNVKKKAH